MRKRRRKMNLFSLLVDATKKYGELPFLYLQTSEKRLVLTYAEFLNTVKKRATEFQRVGIDEMDTIMICAKDPLRILETIFSAWSLGAKVLIVSPLLKESMFSYLEEDLSPALIVFETEFKFYESCKREVNSDNTAIIVFTSGTTLRPKGIKHGHRNILENAKSVSQHIKLSETDKILVLKSLDHISPMSTQIILAILKGSSLYFYNNIFNPQKVMQLINNEEIAYIDVVATQMRYLTHTAKRLPINNSLKYICVNGEHSSNQDLLMFRQVYPKSNILYSYGLSEAGPRVTMLTDEMLVQKLGSVGKSILNVEIKIHKTSQLDNSGEILVKSTGNMLGYWNNNTLTEKTLVNGWLHTSDLGRIDEDGYLYIYGRKDDMIVRGGRNIFPQEIEDVLYSLEDIKECLVVGEKDQNSGYSLLAYVVPHADKILNETIILKALRELIPSFMIPNEILIVDQVPVNISGKKARIKK
jgi:long-chain acyl-CoA synthetase